jgi:hypothetical protein
MFGKPFISHYLSVDESSFSEPQSQSRRASGKSRKVLRQPHTGIHNNFKGIKPPLKLLQSFRETMRLSCHLAALKPPTTTGFFVSGSENQASPQQPPKGSCYAK